jgi:hypothetical protein
MIRVPDEKEIGRCGRRDLIAIIRRLEEDRRKLWRLWVAMDPHAEIPESELEDFR